MATRFINLKPDKRIRTVSLPAALLFIYLSFVNFMVFGDSPIIALSLIPVIASICLIMFQGKSPAYWLKFFFYYTTESRMNANFTDFTSEVKIEDLEEYQKAKEISQRK